MILTTIYALCYALYTAYTSNESIVYPVENAIDYEVQLMQLASELSMLIEENHISKYALSKCQWYSEELIETYTKNFTIVA